jgi:hypothetical protein
MSQCYIELKRLAAWSFGERQEAPRRLFCALRVFAPRFWRFRVRFGLRAKSSGSGVGLDGASPALHEPDNQGDDPCEDQHG